MISLIINSTSSWWDSSSFDSKELEIWTNTNHPLVAAKFLGININDPPFRWPTPIPKHVWSWHVDHGIMAIFFQRICEPRNDISVKLFFNEYLLHRYKDEEINYENITKVLIRWLSVPRTFTKIYKVEDIGRHISHDDFDRIRVCFDKHYQWVEIKETIQPDESGTLPLYKYRIFFYNPLGNNIIGPFNVI